MNSTWKCWLNRLMNRGAGAVKALGFTTRRGSRVIGGRRLRTAIGTLALGTALCGPAWADSAADEGLVRVADGAPAVEAGDGVVKLGDPSATVSAAPRASGAQYTPPYTPMIQPYSGPGPAVANADGYAPVYSDSVGYAMTQDIEQVLYRVGNTSGDIYGANGGYTNFGAFIPFASNGDDRLWYIQPRGGVSDQGRGMMSTGVGYRRYIAEEDRTYSATFWWDGDGGHHAFYNQMGMHFSAVGRYLSWRGGFALPVGSETDRFGSQISDIFYVDDNIGFNITTNVETAYRRYDIEASTPIPYLGRYGTTVGVGAYYLQGPSVEDSMGVSTRIEAQVTEDFWINGLLTSDEIFGANFSLNMELTLPSGMPSKWFRPSTPHDALFATDKRNFRVAAAVNQQTSQALALNPVDGSPIRVAHINPNETDPGNGTIQDPFQSVLEFESLPDGDQSDYDIIFVRRREDNTDTNLNTTITLFDAQRLLGDGTLPGGGVHTFDAIVNGQLEEGLILPGQTAGLLPILSNSGAPGNDVITLANANEVAGFTIDAGTTAAGIRGDGINGFFIHANGIRNAVDGIVITSDTSVPNGYALDGVGVIVNNLGEDLDGDGILDASEDTNANGVLDDGEDLDGDGVLDLAEDLDSDGEIDAISGSGFGSNRGVSITHVAGDLNLLIQNNVVTDFRGEDVDGDGILDPSEDINLNGVLDPGEDTNFNGQLDVAEDKNLNGTLDRGVGIEIIADGGTIFANDPTNPDQPTGILDNELDENGVGLSMTANAAGTIFADIRRITVTNSTTPGPDGAGFELIADGGVFNIETFLNNSSVGNAHRGGQFTAINGGSITIDDGVAGTAAIANNVFADNADDGLRMLADNGSIVIDQIANNVFGAEPSDANGDGVTSPGNGGDGLELATLNTGIITVADPIEDNFFNGNAEDGLHVIADSGSVSVEIGPGNQFNNNGDDGASFETANGGIINTGLSGIVATGNTGAGVEFVLNGGNVTLSDIRGNQFDNNNIGLAIINNDGGSFVTPTVAQNTFNNNIEAGLLIGGEGGSTAAFTNLGTVINNQFNRQVQGFYGIEFDSIDVLTLATLRQNTFIGNGPTSGPGIGGRVDGNTGVAPAGGVQLDLAPLDPANGNLFQNNGDAHIGLVLAGNTNNVINIANHLFQNAVDSTNQTFGSTLYGGDGVAFRLEDESRLTGSVSSSNFLSNAGDGLRLEIFSESLTGFAVLDNFTIGGATPTTGNLFDGNNDDGIHVSRTGAGQVNNVTIRNNLIRNTGDGITNDTPTYNADNGEYVEILDAVAGENQGLAWTTQGDDAIYLAARGVNTQDTYTIFDNTIVNNTDNGVHIQLAGDASISAEVRRNLINLNEGNGVAFTEESAFTLSDPHFLTGVWADNTITNNQFNGVYEAVPTDGLQFGEAGTAFSNVITGNGLNGVAITGVDSPQNAVGSALPQLVNPFSTRYLNNLVANNTGAGNFVAADGTLISLQRNSIDSIEQAGHGFDIDTAIGKVIVIEDSVIRNNVHDGIEFLNGVRTNVGGASVVQILNNTIEFNGDRGVDILNKLVGIGSVDSTLVIDGNNISNNDEEGVYVVNTNSGTQRQNVSSSVNLTEDGPANGAAFLQVVMRDNQLLGNGVNVDQNPPGAAVEPIRASGLVVRVGTSGGGYSQSNPGGFATVAFASIVPDSGYPVPIVDTDGKFEEDFNRNGILDQGEDINGDGVLDTGFGVAGLVNAGVLMELTNNQFAGNFGDDIFFHSFRSTADPATSGGAWSTTDFNPDATNFGNGDPLARLDLIYGDNVFQSAELTPRNVVPHPGTTDGDTGAFYNNAEADWKSRTIRNDASTGPFNSATRRRNAQRLADRVYESGRILSPTVSTDGFSVLYPGMGDSTFRVRGAGSLAGNPLAQLAAEGFVLDDFLNNFIDPPASLIEDLLEVDGSPFNPGVIFGELPFGWGQF